MILLVIDALEHERAERQHRGSDLVALDDVAGVGRALDKVVHEHVDATRAGVAENCDLSSRKIVVRQDPCTKRVVDVVVDVRDAIDDADDFSLERVRLDRPGVFENSVTHLQGEVEPASFALETFDDAEGMLVVAETTRPTFAQQLIERVLACMPERRMAEVVAEADRLDEILIESQGARDPACDPRRLESVRQPRAEVVSFGVDENLRLVAEAAERLRMDDPVAVALEWSAQLALLFDVGAAARLVGANGERGQPPILVLAHQSFEGVSDPSGGFRHPESQTRG